MSFDIDKYSRRAVAGTSNWQLGVILFVSSCLLLSMMLVLTMYEEVVEAENRQHDTTF